jgi:cation transport ATPase
LKRFSPRHTHFAPDPLSYVKRALRALAAPLAAGALLLITGAVWQAPLCVALLVGAEYLTAKAEELRARKLALGLQGLPDTATVYRAGKVLHIPPGEVLATDAVVVREDEVLPCDGVVAKGESKIYAYPPAPGGIGVSVSPGSPVRAASRNGFGLLAIKPAGPASESLYEKWRRAAIIAAERPSHSERRILSAAAILPIGAAAAAAAGFAASLLMGAGAAVSARRAAAVLFVGGSFGLTGAMAHLRRVFMLGAAREGFVGAGGEVMDSLGTATTAIIGAAGAQTMREAAEVKPNPALREGAEGLGKALSEMRIEPVYITGAKAEQASRVSALLGVTDVHAAVLPRDMERVFSELLDESGGKAIYLGSAVNDKVLPEKANPGVLLDGYEKGPGAQLSAAVILGHSPAPLLGALRAAKRARLCMALCSVFTAVTKAAVAGLSFGGVTGAVFACAAECALCAGLWVAAERAVVPTRKARAEGGA